MKRSNQAFKGVALMAIMGLLTLPVMAQETITAMRVFGRGSDSSSVPRPPQAVQPPNNESIALVHDFTSDDGSFSFRFPEGWAVVEIDGYIYLYSDEAVFSIESPADYPEGVVLAGIYPTPQDMPDADIFELSGFNASTIISYYASMAIGTGNQITAPMEIITLDNRDASDVITQENGSDRYYLTIEHDGDDSSLLEAVAAPDQIASVKSTLRAIAETFEVGS